MSKKNVICVIMILTGIAFNFSFENEGVDFLTGLLIGVGVGLLFTSRFRPKVID